MPRPAFELQALAATDVAAVSRVEDSHRTGPAGGRAFDLDRETGDGETGRRQLLEVMQLLDVAIADVASGLVTFPDQTGVPGLGVFLRGVDKRRVPAPAIDSGQPPAPLEPIHLGPVAHAAAAIGVILPAIFGPGAGL